MSSLAGMSAADLQALFGTPSSSARDAEKDAASATVGLVVPGPDRSAKAMQTILTQVQVEKARIEMGGRDGPVAFVQAAYDVHLGNAGSTASYDAKTTSQGGTSLRVTAVTDAQGKQADEFDLSLSYDHRTIEIAFAVEGLGLSDPRTQSEIGGYSVTFGNSRGGSSDFFQVDMPVEGGTNQTEVAFNVQGLDAYQAQKVAAAFQLATAAPSTAKSTVGAGGIYHKSYGSDFSADYSFIVGY